MRRWTAIGVLAAVVVAVAAFALGRATAPAVAPAPQGYLDGLRAGAAQGRQEGRAEQEGAALPAGDRAAVHDAFQAGYVAGGNDAFGAFDGGWTLGVPWVVVLERGSGQLAYRIARRSAVEPGVDYVLCPDRADLCPR